MKRITLFFSLAWVSLSALNAQSIDSENSVVNFSISHIKLNTVHGSFVGMKGEISFDEADLASSWFRVSIDAASVNTGNEKRDNHLRNEDFFDVTQYPEISFESRSILKVGSSYKAKGVLTMHGVSKEVEIAFTYADNAFNGTLEISRFDYQVGEKTRALSVGEFVSLEISCKLN